ncbi:hypothetical protein FALCPG4_001132 [Fusarium falciforme]
MLRPQGSRILLSSRLPAGRSLQHHPLSSAAPLPLLLLSQGPQRGATRTAATGIAVSVAIAVQRARPGQSYVAPGHTSPWSQAQPDPAEYPAPSIHHLFLFFDS